MTQHSDYGGSNGDRWLNCALTTSLSKKVPRRPAGPAAEHGTAPWTTRDGCEGWSR